MKVGIVGLGYVGIPLCFACVNAGIPVNGIDTNDSKLSGIKEGKSYLSHYSDNSFSLLKEKGSFGSDFSFLSDCTHIVLTLPTPLSDDLSPDLSYVEGGFNSCLEFLVEGQTLILESTTYPGTTRDILAKGLMAKGFNLGENFFLAYSPEREDPGNTHYTRKNTPKVLSGYTENCLEKARGFYEKIVGSIVEVSSLEAAEMTKLLENVYRAVNIGLVNECKIVADKMGIDIFEVIEAAGSKPFGYTPFYPGPGLGGHCLPVDPFYLSHKAKNLGVETKITESAGVVNRAMPSFIISKITEELGPLENINILVIGISYKKNVNDLRESPGLELINLLIKEKAIVSYSDVFVDRLEKYNLSSSSLTEECLAMKDAVLIATNHDSVNYDFIQKNSKLIFDSRNCVTGQNVTRV